MLAINPKSSVRVMVATVSFFSSARMGMRGSPESWHKAQRCWNTVSPEGVAAGRARGMTIKRRVIPMLAKKNRAGSLKFMRPIL